MSRIVNPKEVLVKQTVGSREFILMGTYRTQKSRKQTHASRRVSFFRGRDGLSRANSSRSGPHSIAVSPANLFRTAKTTTAANIHSPMTTSSLR